MSAVVTVIAIVIAVQF